MEYSFEEDRRLLSMALEQVSRVCPECGRGAHPVKNRGSYTLKCENKFCQTRVGLWKGTIFEHAHLRPEVIMAVFRLWHWGLPKDLIPDVLPVSKAAIGNLMKKASTSVVGAYYRDAGLLGGEGVIVEVDESKFGKRKYHRGHRIEGLWVFGMVERTPERRLILIGVENREGETLIGAMLRYVHPASIIYSDGWRGYSRVREHFAAHFVVNHSRHFVDLLTGAHTNTIEGNWSAVKEKIPRRSRTVELAPIYLIRFMLMRNEGEYSILTLIKYLFR